MHGVDRYQGLWVLIANLPLAEHFDNLRSRKAQDRKNVPPGLNENPQSLLRAVLAADTVAYSRLMPEDPAGTISSLVFHRKRMTDIAGRNRGSVVATPGDYILALFETTGDALEAAIEFVEALEHSSGPVPLQFRVGLHVGDVYERDGDYLGVAINVASRLQQAAPAGGIIMSQSFRESLPGKGRHRVRYVGELELKNVDDPMRAFAVEFGSGTGTPAPRSGVPAPSENTTSAPAARQPRAVRPSITVRPFLALGKAERATVFADGLTEELVTTLGVFSDAMRSAPASEPMPAGAGFEISGQVRNGDRLRITCHLTDRLTGEMIWSDRFDFQNDASYDAQERITVAVITALQIRLTDGESAEIWSSRKTSLAAWEHFHRGRMCEARYTRESNQRAKRHFVKSIELDPEFVPAVVALGFSHLDAIRLGWSPEVDRELGQAVDLARSAMAKEPEYPYAKALMAYAERAMGQLDKSIRSMESAVSLAPRNGELVAYFANMLWMHGDKAGATAQYKRALTLIPQPNSWIYTNLGLAVLSDGKASEAREIFENVIESDPEYVRAHIGLVVALAREGRLTDASGRFRVLRMIDPGFEPERWLAQNQFLKEEEAISFVSDLRAASIAGCPMGEA